MLIIYSLIFGCEKLEN